MTTDTPLEPAREARSVGLERSGFLLLLGSMVPVQRVMVNERYADNGGHDS